MAKLLKLRRGSTSQHGSFTGAEGEVTVDTDKDVLVVHDGSTAGGHPLAAQDMDNVPAGSILGTQLENSGVTAGQYGSSSAIPIVTVDAQGLVTAASTTAIDSTTISNGSASVAVASNGPITSNANHDFSAGIDVTGRFTTNGDYAYLQSSSGSNASITLKKSDANADSIDYIQCRDNSNALKFKIGGSGNGEFAGNLDVGAGIDVTGAITSTGDMTITNTNPKIALIDSNSNSDFEVQNDNGNFNIEDTTNSANRLRIDANGAVSIPGPSLTCTGNLVASDGTFNGGDLTVSGTTAVIHLTDTNNDDDFSVMNANGNFIIRDVTNSLDRLMIDSNGSGTINGGSYQFNVATTTFNSSTDQKIILTGSNSPYIRFKNAGGTDTAYLQHNNDGNIYLWNQSVNRGLQLGSQPYFYDGAYRQMWHSNNDGASSGLDADLLDGVHGTSYLRADAGGGSGSYQADADITFNGGAGAVTIAAGSDIRLGNNSTGWTGDHAGKIQHHGSILYIQGGTNGSHCVIFRDPDGTNRCQVNGDGHFTPMTDNTYDLGGTSYRWRNVYTTDLHLSNEGHSNDVDGTWGNWTIQEGESDLFLKNNRSGKKYKFNLTEVS